jgi:CheY-like chemotaxis protein
VVLRRDGPRAEILVRDTGKGIAPQFLPYVFDRFRQADASTTRKHGGLGLGLAIVRHLVELHGGTVEAASAGEGQGATFTVSLPLEDAPRPIGLPEPVPSGECAPDFLAGRRVLVVDDEPDTLEVVAHGLRSCGADVVGVASVDEALREFERVRPQVVVSDIGMPERDGFELMRAIRSLPAARGGTVPAIAMTAFAAQEDRVRALATGFQDHVAKPVTPSALATVIAEVLRRHPSESHSS